MKKKQKIPMRTCIITRESLPKKELIRIVRLPDETIQVDTTGKLSGRGAYLKKDKVVIAKAKKHKLLERHLAVAIPIEIYEQVEALIENDTTDT